MLENLLFVGAALLLVLLNGFFVAAEFALVKLRHTQATTLAASSREIATRLAVVGPYVADVDRTASSVRHLMNATTADESGRIPSPIQRSCLPLSGCSR